MAAREEGVKKSAVIVTRPLENISIYKCFGPHLGYGACTVGAARNSRTAGASATPNGIARLPSQAQAHRPRTRLAAAGPRRGTGLTRSHSDGDQRLRRG